MALNEMEMMANQTPELQDALSRIYTEGNRDKLLQKKLAAALRMQKEGEQPKGAGVGPYNVYVAPNIAQNTKAMLSEWKGGQQESAIQKKMAELIGQKEADNTLFAKWNQGQAQAGLAAQKEAEAARAAQGGYDGPVPQMMGDTSGAVVGKGTPQGPPPPGSFAPPGMDPALLNVGVHPVPPPGPVGPPGGIPGAQNALQVGPAPGMGGVQMMPSHKPADPNDPNVTLQLLKRLYGG
jgi:hypothetical protein